MPIVGVPATIAAIYTTDAAQSIAHGVRTIVDFEDKVRDTHNAVTTGAAWKFTAPAAGFYQVSAVILFNSSTGWADTDTGQIQVFVNDVLIWTLDYKDSYGSTSAVYMHLNGGALVYLNAGDTLDVRAYQTSGAALALLSLATSNRISIVKV